MRRYHSAPTVPYRRRFDIAPFLPVNRLRRYFHDLDEAFSSISVSLPSENLLMPNTSRNGEDYLASVRPVAASAASIPAASSARGNLRSGKLRTDPEALLLATARYAPWALAVLFLAVSMPHLSTGFQCITGCSVITGWLMAVAIDCAQVTSKLQLTLAGKLDVGRSAKRTALAIILASTGLSMTLNVLGFSAHVEEVGGGRIGVTLAWVAGILLPLLILGLSYSGSAYCLAKQRPSTTKNSQPIKPRHARATR